MTLSPLSLVILAMELVGADLLHYLPQLLLSCPYFVLLLLEPG
jgi:hypothetical protein